MEDILPIIDLLPPNVRAIVYAVLSVVGICGVLVATVQGVTVWLLGLPQPHDPAWKTAVFRFLAVLEPIALNLVNFRALLEICRKEKVIRDLQSTTRIETFPPPPGPGAGVE